MSQIDSLSANEFEVQLNGEKVDGVFRVSGLTPLRSDSATHPFQLSKMVQRDPALPFNVWLRETLAAKGAAAHPTRTLTIIALDEGVESRRWTVTGAWISEIRYSEFNSASSELVEECAIIHYGDMQMTWTS
ncbi:MAG: hypothetical protein IAE80_03160 [Anaerolinea sp.]|nr:hypothetical protein [Anaerolinea sp.]